jgi:hypothetical protein
MMKTEMSEPIGPYKDMEDPYTKYIINVPKIVEDSREIQTIDTEDHIAEMKEVVENALAIKQTLSTIDYNLCSTPPADKFKQPQINCWLMQPTPPELAMYS